MMTTEKLPRGRAMMLTGIVVGILGILALFSPITTGGAVIKIVGVVLLLAGLAEFVHAFRVQTRFDTIMSTTLAVITLAAAVLLLVDTDAGAGFLTIVLIVFFVLQGIWKISYALRFREVQGWPWLMGTGALSLLLAWLMWKQWPLSGAWATGVFIGVDFILTGAALVFLALQLRKLAAAAPVQATPD